jgi:hypothetical protein
MQPKNKSFFDKIIQQICRGKEIRSFIAERQTFSTSRKKIGMKSV